MKPTLAMIPALCCDAGLYQGFEAALADLADVKIMSVAAPTFAACGAQILEAIDGPFIAMGTSFGGHVARELALAAPERVKGLWIMGAGCGAVADPEGGRARGAALREGREEEIYQAFAKIIAHVPGPLGIEARDSFLDMARRGDPARAAVQNDALLGRIDRWGDIYQRIECPALLLWGRHDQFSPAADGLRMAGIMPKARFVELPDCGHLPSLEAPAETIDAARHWLLDNFA